MHILIKNSSNQPIYEQIKEQIKKQILDSSLKEGEKLPSIRSLAKELRISVITTKKAYDVLEQEGLIHSVQGKGSFVAAKNMDLVNELNRKKCEGHLLAAMEYGKRLGLSNQDLLELMDLLEENDD